MTFRGRLIVSLGALTAVVLLTAVSAVVALQLVVRADDHVVELTNDLDLVHDARLQAEQVVAVGRGYLLTGTEDNRARLDEVDARLSQTLHQLRRRAVGSDSGDELRVIAQDASDYMQALHAAARKRVAAGDPSAIVGLFEQEILPLRRTFEADVDRYVQARRHQIMASSDEAHALARSAQIGLVILVAAGLLVAFALATIIARKLLEQYRRIERATEAAHRATAARDEVLAVVAHDLRGPLATVAMGSALLRETIDSPAEQRVAARLVNASERMQHLIEDLLQREQLDLGRVVLDLSEHDVREVLATAVELHLERARVKAIELRVEPANGTVSADRERLLQVLSNLIGNALKFARAQDIVTVRARHQANETRIEVADTGPGVPAEHIPHLFDRYYRGQRPGDGGGLGLGLFICKRLVEAHRGRIGVDSAPGRGSTFWFSIPDGAPAAARDVSRSDGLG